MLKDTIYIFQFQDPQEKQPSNFDWSLDMDEVDQNAKLLDINNKEYERTTDLIFNSDGDIHSERQEEPDKENIWITGNKQKSR